MGWVATSARAINGRRGGGGGLLRAGEHEPDGRGEGGPPREGRFEAEATARPFEVIVAPSAAAGGVPPIVACSSASSSVVLRIPCRPHVLPRTFVSSANRRRPRRHRRQPQGRQAGEHLNTNNSVRGTAAKISDVQKEIMVHCFE